MITSLSALTRLKHIPLCFRSPGPRFHPDEENGCPPLPSRVFLPALSKVIFSGVSEYLEDLVTPINAPLLGQVSISFFHQPDWNISQFHQFIRGAEKFRAPDQVEVVFGDVFVKVTLSPRNPDERTILQFRDLL
jgi:hypothetical protein